VVRERLRRLKGMVVKDGSPIYTAGRTKRCLKINRRCRRAGETAQARTDARKNRSMGADVLGWLPVSG
jgi:hypothetical protein